MLKLARFCPALVNLGNIPAVSGQPVYLTFNPTAASSSTEISFSSSRCWDFFQICCHLRGKFEERLLMED